MTQAPRHNDTNNTPQKVAYSERRKALLLLWFLDGYHRLSEDFNASLCVDVEGVFARMLKQNHLYGPVRSVLVVVFGLRCCSGCCGCGGGVVVAVVVGMLWL